MSKKQSICNEITLIVTTYNRPDYLELVLKSILRQTMLPEEVIIADDGSTQETFDLIAKYAKIFPVKLIHSWIPDKGFRLAKSRNKAISIAKGEYIIVTDGDIVLAKSFVADHVLLKEKGYFVTGGRSLLLEKATKRRLVSKNEKFTIFSPGLLRPLKLLRLPWLGRFKNNATALRKVCGCNISFWKADCIAVNGFEEKMEGWGHEDREFIVRLFNYGIKRKHAYGLAPCVHLYHHHGDVQESKLRNQKFVNDSIAQQNVTAKIGISQYLQPTNSK